MEPYTSKRQGIIIGVLLVALTAISLFPGVRLVRDWYSFSRLVRPADAPIHTTRGFDWIHWADNEGQITAEYVFPRGPGSLAGIRRGDVLYELDFQQYFTAFEIRSVVDGTPPGETRVYTISRGDEMESIDVELGRYPVFIYPLSAVHWAASLWGFVVGSFLHLLALIIVVPLSRRSRPAVLALILIISSAIWVFGNLLRLLAIQWFGPAESGTLYGTLFQGLTIASLGGWIAFPVMLVRKVLCDFDVYDVRGGWLRRIIYVPPIILALAAVSTILSIDFVAPVSLEAFIGPVLFYVCCYVALATGLNLFLSMREQTAVASTSVWSRAGSLTLFLVSFLAALSIYGIVPILGAVTDAGAAWLVVGAQLLSVAPVLLVTVATLRYGKVDRVLTRTVAYVAVLGLFFFLFVGAMSFLRPVLDRMEAPTAVISGLLAVWLLFLFDRGRRIIGPYTAAFLQTERQRARRHLSDFVERMRSVVNPGALTAETIDNVASAFEARSAALFLSLPDGEPGFLSASYHPEPPYVTQDLVARVWPAFEKDRQVWSRNSEINFATIGAAAEEELMARQVAVAVPVLAERGLIGLLVLGRKKGRRAVYNLEDIDLARSVCSHLALALERLELVERERQLVRTTAESQLAALRAQINPHFLFNTLNAIASLIEEKPEEAEQTVEHLAAIFRHTLDTGGETFVSLKQELDLVDHYLSIECIRFGSRLRVKRMLNTRLDGLPVPAFSIQTIVENAVKHGLARIRQGGTLTISTSVEPGNLAQIRVHDSGAGIPQLFGLGETTNSEEIVFGIGLSNVADRLRHLYDRNDLLRIKSDPETGTDVRLLIPVTEEGAFEPR